MTKEELEQHRAYLRGGDTTDFPGLARVGSALLEEVERLQAQLAGARDSDGVAWVSPGGQLRVVRGAGAIRTQVRVERDGGEAWEAVAVFTGTSPMGAAVIQALAEAVASEESIRAERARHAALEEAAQRMERWPGLRDNLPAGEYEDAATRAANALRAIKAQPARRFVAVETVREKALATIAAGPDADIARTFGPSSVHTSAVRDLMTRLGLSLYEVKP